MTIGKKLAAGFGSILLLFAVIGAIAYRDTAYLLESASRVTHSNQVLDRLDGLLVDLVDAEAGEHGYLLTQDEAYLESYGAALQRLQSHRQELSGLVTDDGQRRRIEALNPLIESRKGEMAEAVRLAGKEGFAAAASLARTYRVKATMDQIRTAIAEMNRVETQLLKGREAEARKTAGRTLALIAWGTALAVLAAAGIGFAIARGVTLSIGQLVNGMQKAALGVLSHRIEATSRDELGELSVAFNQMLEERQVQHEITRILAESLTLSGAAPRLLEAFGATLGWERGNFWQVDTKTDALRHLASWHRSPEETDFDAASRALSFRHDVGLPGRVWTSRQATWAADVTRDSGFQRRGVATSEGLRTCVAFPVCSDGEIHGVIELFSRQIRQLEDVFLQKLTSLGGQIGQFVARRRAEEGLRKSEGRFRRLFDSSTIRIAVTDLGGHTVEANDAYLDMLGYGRDELIAGTLGWNEMTPPEYQDRDRLAMAELKRTGVARPWEKELFRKDGSRVPVLIGMAMLDESAESCIVYVVDLSKRRRAEESARTLLHAVEQAGNIILITNGEGEITYVNPAFEATYGFSREEALGRTPRILKSGRHDEAYYRQLWGVLLSGGSFRSEIVNKTRDGRLVTLEMSANQVLDGEGKRTGFIAVQHDVTARKALEEQFRQSQKMEAVGRLAGGVAHDFNNLLTVILGYSDIIMSREPRDMEIQEIRRAGERASALTRQLLAFSRKQVLEPVVLSPNELIRNLEGMLRRLIAADVDFATELDPSAGSVRADPGQLEQVVINLAVNARDAMPRGGKVTIQTANVELDEAYARQHALVAPEAPVVTPGPYVMLAVGDTGVGMDAETLARIFEPFFTTKEKGKGTGLGLSTVHGIVHQSGGNLWVHSEPGKGTTFKVYLPRVEEAPMARETPSGVHPSIQGTETILLVEDEGSIRALARMILESKGYRIIEAKSGPEALDLARESGDPIHLLLTDLVMPEMAGTELASRLVEFRPDVRILYMSGYSDDAVVRHGLPGHGHQILQKPFTPKILLRKVREALSLS